jgi:hypothetical protein
MGRRDNIGGQAMNPYTKEPYFIGAFVTQNESILQTNSFALIVAPVLVVPRVPKIAGPVNVDNPKQIKNQKYQLLINDSIVNFLFLK